MSDLPSYNSKKEDSEKDDSIKLTKENANDIMNYINTLA